MSEKMTRDSPVEHSFKNKGTAKTQTLPLAPILLVQNSADVGEAGVEGILLVQNSVDVREVGVEEITSATGTCKGSLNRSWGCSVKTLRCSSQYSVPTEMDHSNGILAEFRDRV